MRFSVATAAAALVAGVAAQNGTVAYVTDVVTDYTTYCPEATSFAVGGTTYTVSTATTLTILNCSCTVTKPASSTIATVVPVTLSSATLSSASVPVTTSAVVSPVTISSTVPVYTSAPIYKNATSTATVGPVGTGSSTTTKAPVATFSGAANKAFAASGAGLAAVFGLVAYAL